MSSFFPSILASGFSLAYGIGSCRVRQLTNATVSFEKSSRSVVWKYFRREAHRSICLLCQKDFVYRASRGTTSNLLAHLQRKHPSDADVHVEVKVEGQPSRSSPGQQSSILKYATVQARNTKPCPPEVQAEITRILSRWPWQDMRPISIVRDRGVRDLLAFLEPNYEVPSTTRVSTLIRKEFDDGKTALGVRLKNVVAGGLALTSDIWTSKATQAFATTTGHYVDNEWNHVSCVLETVRFPGHPTGICIADQI